MSIHESHQPRLAPLRHSAPTRQPDCVVIGGGVIGLSVAYELAVRGRVCTLVDQPMTSYQASWAAAGILPTPHVGIGADPTESLRMMSHPLHADWSARLRQETGIDNEFRLCGGVHLAADRAEATALAVSVSEIAMDGGKVERLTPAELARLEPHLDVSRVIPHNVYLLPAEAQIRPPRHLQALRQACRQRGVTMVDSRVTDIRTMPDGTVRTELTSGTVDSDYACLAAGAWTGEFLRARGIRTGVEPIRGQMVLWHTDQPLVNRVINEGLRYIVSRHDGYLLAGATIDECGFDNDSHERDLQELVAFTTAWLPELRHYPVAATWSGLRAGSRRGRPYLGPVPGEPHILVATGHYRSGLHLAPATATILADLIEQRPLEIDLAPFQVSA